MLAFLGNVALVYAWIVVGGLALILIVTIARWVADGVRSLRGNPFRARRRR